MASTQAFRVTALLAWALLLGVFWLGARGAEVGPVEYLLGAIDGASPMPWAPVWLLTLYLLRPLMLVPITLLNLASGLLLGPLAGVALALAGTLISASVGYGIGRLIGTYELAESLAARWPLVRTLRQRSFETVLGGGLMYLHADMVNLPAGMLRIRFPTFLLGIIFGNSLTLTTAVLAGASVDGGLLSASPAVDVEYLVMAASLFLVSVVLAQLLRRRVRPAE